MNDSINTHNSEAVWFIFDTKLKAPMGPFDSTSAINYISQQKLNLAEVKVCQRGWKSWKLAVEAPDFLQNYSQNLSDLPSFPEISDEASQVTVTHSAPEPSTEVNAAEPDNVVSLQNIKKNKVAKEIQQEVQKETKNLRPEEKRKYVRIDIRLKATFIFEQKTFRTFTKNVSEGGILLEENLPQHLNDKKLEVFLTSPDQKINIKLKAHILKNDKVSKHIQFVDLSEKNVVLLQSWLKNDLKNYILKNVA